MKRTRTGRRAQSRVHTKLVRDRERLARLAPGGSAERPIAIDSPAQVDVMAAARPCPLCDGPLRLEAHDAFTAGGLRRRVAHVACTACGSRRAVWFELREVLH